MSRLPPLQAQVRSLNRIAHTTDAYASVMAKSPATLRAEADSLEDLAVKYARDAEALAQSNGRTRLQILAMAGDYAWRALLFRDAAEKGRATLDELAAVPASAPVGAQVTA